LVGGFTHHPTLPLKQTLTLNVARVLPVLLVQGRRANPTPSIQFAFPNRPLGLPETLGELSNAASLDADHDPLEDQIDHRSDRGLPQDHPIS
jgi:hypothetical protein